MHWCFVPNRLFKQKKQKRSISVHHFDCLTILTFSVMAFCLSGPGSWVFRVVPFMNVQNVVSFTPKRQMVRFLYLMNLIRDWQMVEIILVIQYKRSR